VMKIGQVAKRVDLPTSTIRYYEKIDLLPQPERESGQRIYSEKAIDLLKVIKIACNLGYSLAEIKPLLDAFQAKHQPTSVCHEITSKKLAELDELINKLYRMKSALTMGLDCECTDICDCYLHPHQSSPNLSVSTQRPAYPKPVPE